MGSQNVYRVKTYKYKTGSIYEIVSKNVNNVDHTWYRSSYILIKMLKPQICVS